jgi:hypothetical protein
MGKSNSEGWNERKSSSARVGYRDTFVSGSSSSYINLDNSSVERLEGRFNNTAKQNTEARDGDTGSASGNSFDMADTSCPNWEHVSREECFGEKLNGASQCSGSNMADTKGGANRNVSQDEWSFSGEVNASGDTGSPIGRHDRSRDEQSLRDINMADTDNIGCDGAEGVAPKQSGDGQDNGISVGRDISAHEHVAEWTNNEDGWWRQLAASRAHQKNDMADAKSYDSRCEAKSSNNISSQANRSANRNSGCSGSSAFLHDAIWLNGADGKTRRAPGLPQPGLCGLADGVSAGMDGLRPSIPLLTTQTEARAGKLKALGNAIVPQLAAEFIKAIMEVYE